MKTKLTLALSLMVLANLSYGQWTATCPELTSCNVGIGAVSTPGAQLHVATTGAIPLFVERTAGQPNGLKLFFTSNPATGILTGAGSAIFQNQATVSDMLFMPTPTSAGLIIKSGGNVGVNTTTPSEKFSVVTSAVNDGISVTQNGSNAAALHLYNTTSGGNHWALFSAGNGNSQGSGNFSIYEYGAGLDRLFIDGTSGNVGIGNTTPVDARLEVKVDGSASFNRGLFSLGYRTTGSSTWNAGIEGEGGSNDCSAQNFGVRGFAYNGNSAYGGYFSAKNINSCTGTTGIGVYADGFSQAAYFSGNVVYTGTLSGPSDRKLKDNIQPLQNVLDKIKLLKPSAYTFRVDEFKDMKLPAGQQMGLIAQELEQVFPELIQSINAVHTTDEKGTVLTDIPAYKSVNYMSLIPALIAGMQEQQKQIEAQQQTIDALVNKQSTTTGINQLSNPLDGFTMDQNVPNPFSNETVINYNLPQQTTNAALIVYDLTGKQITSFPLNQKGAASISITSEKLQAGIYIYSIVADGKVMGSKRMIVAEK